MRMHRRTARPLAAAMLASALTFGAAACDDEVEDELGDVGEEIQNEVGGDDEG